MNAKIFIRWELDTQAKGLGALRQGVYCCHCQLAVMGWKGGTIHQAREAMRNALERVKKFFVVFRVRPSQLVLEREVDAKGLATLKRFPELVEIESIEKD